LYILYRKKIENPSVIGRQFEIKMNERQFPFLKQSSKLFGLGNGGKESAMEEEKGVGPTVKSKESKISKKEILPPIKKPENFDCWVRMKEESNDSIYYYNTISQGSAWLSPCSTCYRTSDKWCIQCKLSYCERHFLTTHFPNNEHLVDCLLPENQVIDRNELRFHQWSTFELDNEMEPLQDGDEYCINCECKPAMKLCAVCWDPYCHKCFEIVHHVGALKEHKGLNIKRAKYTWYGEREEKNHEDKNKPMNCLDLQDYRLEDHIIYVNGFTGDRTKEKHTDLMSDLERILLQNWKTHQKAVEDYSKIAEDLDRELNKAQQEKDKISIQRAQLAHQIQTKIEDAQKKKKKGKK
jgi:hypothetical protein